MKSSNIPAKAVQTRQWALDALSDEAGSGIDLSDVNRHVIDEEVVLAALATHNVKSLSSIPSALRTKPVILAAIKNGFVRISDVSQEAWDRDIALALCRFNPYYLHSIPQCYTDDTFILDVAGAPRYQGTEGILLFLANNDRLELCPEVIKAALSATIELRDGVEYTLCQESIGIPCRVLRSMLGIPATPDTPMSAVEKGPQQDW